MANSRTLFMLALGLTVIGAPAMAAPFEIAVLQGMDKVTARVSTIEAPVGEVVKFGALEIIARNCDKRPPRGNARKRRVPGYLGGASG